MPKLSRSASRRLTIQTQLQSTPPVQKVCVTIVARFEMTTDELLERLSDLIETKDKIREYGEVVSEELTVIEEKQKPRRGSK